MPRRSSGFIALIACAALILIGFSASSDTALAADKEKKKAETPLTIGGLAQRLVAEMAIDAPVGGYDETFSVGVMTYIGYKGSGDVDAPATLGDMQSMLKSVGVTSATASPKQALSSQKVESTLNAVRGSLPKFEVPEGRRRHGRETGRKRNTSAPGPCGATFQICRKQCLQKSPSGRSGGVLGGCVKECNQARRQCRRGFENAIYAR